MKQGTLDTAAWREFQWEEKGIRGRVPASWQQPTVTPFEFEVRAPEEALAYLSLKAYAGGSYLPSTEEELRAKLQTAAQQLGERVILGYSLRKVGNASGVLLIYLAGDWLNVAWEGHVLIKGRGADVTILMGAPKKDSDQTETIFDAILSSVTFEP